MSKWKPKRGGGNFEDRSGRAKVKYYPDKNSMLVHFHPDTENEKVADKKFAVAKWPEWVKPELVDKFVWKVTLGKDSIYSMHPYSLRELVTFEVSDISHKKDQPPMPLEKQGAHGKYYIFFPILKIVDGPDGVIGSELSLYFPYNVEADNDSEYIKITGFGSTGKWGERLDTFWDITGVYDYGPIKYSDNILPVVLKRQLRARKQIIGQIKDGYVVYDSLDAAHSSDWDENDSDAALWDEDSTPEPEFEGAEEFVPVVEEDEEVPWEDDETGSEPEDSTDDEFDWDD